MAHFNWGTCEIGLRCGFGQYHGTIAEVTRIPADPDATMSFAHEYFHFLQLISSLSGLHILGELIDFGAIGALLLAGHKEGDRITARHRIIPILAGMPAGAGRKLTELTARREHFGDQAKVLFGMDDYACAGTFPAWSLIEQVLTVGGYTEPFVGIVTPRNTFRPITPGLLAEGMARRMDQWLKANAGFAGHHWAAGVIEDEFYNGIRNVLSQPEYSHNVAPTVVGRLTVVVCSLALACDRPDWAVSVMLGRLRHANTAGGLVQSIAITLLDLLKRDDVRQLNARSYNEVVDDLQHGSSRLIAR
jgi:hypothetical protein